MWVWDLVISIYIEPENSTACVSTRYYQVHLSGHTAKCHEFLNPTWISKSSKTTAIWRDHTRYPNHTIATRRRWKSTNTPHGLMDSLAVLVKWSDSSERTAKGFKRWISNRPDAMMWLEYVAMLMLSSYDSSHTSSSFVHSGVLSQDPFVSSALSSQRNSSVAPSHSNIRI